VSCKFLTVLYCLCSSEEEKVEGEELQKWLRLVVAPTELIIFMQGKQQTFLPLQTGS
jgi:cell division protease FtsH